MLAEGRAEPRGRLRVSAPVLFGQMHVAPALIEFAAIYPDVEVELVLLDRVVDLVEEGVDVAVRLAPLADSSMIAIRAGAVGRVVVAAPELLERAGAPTHPSDLADRPCVVFSGTAPGGSWRFVDEGRPLNVPIASAFETNDATVALEACAAGLGFGQLLSYQAAPFVRDGRLRTSLDAFAIEPVPISLVYPGSRFVSARLRAFLDWMRDALRGSVSGAGPEITPAR